jgi:hypothetical protein
MPWPPPHRWPVLPEGGSGFSANFRPHRTAKVELKISSTCHRRGYTLRIVGDCQTVSDTFVTKRFYAKRVKWAWEGVYLFSWLSS